MYNKLYLLIVLLVGLASCKHVDDSFYITDDRGEVHKTMSYLKDKRGRHSFPVHITATGHRQLFFDPKAFAWAAYDEKGNRVMTGIASGGMDYCEDISKPCRTVSGTFRIYKKKGIDCKSSEYPGEDGGARMSYCMYFYRGYTIHAAYELEPEHSSHGCVRVLPSAAKWLNEQFVSIGTKVTILSYADEDGDKFTATS